MMSDYEVLGLKEGADEKEIKRAYFKLVRQFSPEKDPERFQQIREAYENLKKGKGQIKLSLQIPADPFAEKMFQQIETLYGQRSYRRAMETAEEAIRYYGEYDGFLYYLAVLQRENNYRGKAVKSFEKLVKKNPDNVLFAKELAKAYLERGYGKKAYAAFGKAYDMGCREVDFLNDYAINCRDRGDYKRGMTLLLELVGVARTDRREYMMNLLEAHSGLYIFCRMSGGERIEEIRDSFLSCLEEAAPYMAEYQEFLGDVLATVVYELREMDRFDAEFQADVCGKLRLGLDGAKADALWRDVKKSIEYELLDEDPRISEVMKTWFEEISFEDYMEDKADREVMRYILLDCKLCILEEWPGIREEFTYIKEHYPGFYEEIREYAETLEHTKNIDYLRDRMKKDYDRLGRYMPVGMYEEKYGQRRSQPEKITAKDFGMDFGVDFGMGSVTDPYVRTQPKIGRNDPCPCGSGKKYKKCCGK